MSRRIFLTGGSGLLALNWAADLRTSHDVVLGLHERQVRLDGTEGAPCRLETLDDARRTLAGAEPSLVIHTAGLTSVEGCEADPDLARLANVTLAANVAVACAEAGVPLVHVSTDHLFDGTDPLATETRPVSPLNVYGATKAEAEREVLDAHPDALVVRTNFYAWGMPWRSSFSDMIVDGLRAGRSLTLFHDVFYTPIHTAPQREAVFDLVAAGARGVVNVVGDERLSKLDFGRRLAEVFGLDADLIQAGSITDRTALVQRPMDMSLSNERARTLLGRSLGGVDAHLTLLQQQERSGLAQELRTL